MFELVADKKDGSDLTQPTDEKGCLLRLYVAGHTVNSNTAIGNLRRICEQYMPGQYHIDVIDLMVNPHLAKVAQIVAIPTLVRELPAPPRRIIGDLSDTQRVLLALDIFPISFGTTYAE